MNEEDGLFFCGRKHQLSNRQSKSIKPTCSLPTSVLLAVAKGRVKSTSNDCNFRGWRTSHRKWQKLRKEDFDNLLQMGFIVEGHISNKRELPVRNGYQAGKKVEPAVGTNKKLPN